MTNLERFSLALDRKPVDRVLTWDFVDNEQILVRHGGYDKSKTYSFEQIVEMNATSFKAVGLDMTRYTYDPVNHWMGSKIVNWIRFFGVDPDNWKVEQKGGTAWIAKRPFTTLAELEKHMPKLPKLEDIREWFTPFITYIKQVCDRYDLVWVGGVEGPVTDTYSYMDMELFAQAIYDAPELVSHIMDCTGKFSAYIAQVYAEHPSSPLLFMGEDICGSGGPIFSPQFIREHAVPRWHWIMDPDSREGPEVPFPHGRPVRGGPADHLGDAGGGRPAPHGAQRVQRYLRHPRPLSLEAPVRERLLRGDAAAGKHLRRGGRDAGAPGEASARTAGCSSGPPARSTT